MYGLIRETKLILMVLEKFQDRLIWNSSSIKTSRIQALDFHFTHVYLILTFRPKF